MDKRVFINYSARKWFLIILAFSAGGGTLTFYFLTRFTNDYLSIALGSSLAVIIFGLISGILVMLDKHRQVLSEEIQATKREVQSTINIRPFTNYPINLGGWAISACFLDRLIREIEIRKPNLVVECGSGTSTIVIAACLKQLGKGRIVSLDHEEKYANITRNLLNVEGLEDCAQVITAPLEKMEINNQSWHWYAFDPAIYFESNIDILSVDGPPGYINPLSRYPALPKLAEYLSNNCLIMLDDGNRTDEMQIANRWTNDFDLKSELIKEGRGFWIFEVNHAT